MLGRGYLFALAPDEVALLSRCEGQGEVLVLLEVLRVAGAPCSEVDKAWLALHRCLSSDDRDAPLARAVLGRKVLLDRDGALATVLPAEEVGEVARALDTIGEAEFRVRWVNAGDGEGPDGESEELDLLYAWSWFQRLRDHHRAAARAGRAVLFTARLWAASARPGAAA
jgi:hypothetical protein